MRKNINGILLLNKPKGISSNAALQRVKRLFHAKKAGHTGSLDPIATGMLPICFGEATKFSQYLLDSHKQYRVVAKLGAETTTGDIEGEVVQTYPIKQITRERLQAIFATLEGEQEQIPPMYSAIKHQGQPLYKLARQGIEVHRNPRKITIFSLTLVDFDEATITADVHCSKGTYIRTLVEDIGRALGCGAHVIELERTVVAPYAAGTAHSITELEAILDREGRAGLEACLLPVESSVSQFPALKLANSSAFYLKMGQAVRCSVDIATPLVRLFSEDEHFLGLGVLTDDGRVKPQRLVV